MISAKVRNIAPIKGVIGKKRITELKKAIKNRNARTTYWTKKLKGDEATVDDYKKLARAQYLPPMISVDFSKITTIKEYNALLRMINADKSTIWKENRTSAMRNWLAKAIQKTLWIDETVDPELFNKIRRMTDRDILQFKMTNANLIKEIFDKYMQVLEDVERDYIYIQVRIALGLEPRSLDPNTPMVI